MCRVGSLTWGQETSVTPGRETLGDLGTGGWRWETESLMTMIWTVTRRQGLRRLELGFWGRGWRSSHKRCTDRWTAPAGNSPPLERLLGAPGGFWGLLEVLGHPGRPPHQRIRVPVGTSNIGPSPPRLTRLPRLTGRSYQRPGYTTCCNWPLWRGLFSGSHKEHKLF